MATAPSSPRWFASSFFRGSLAIVASVALGILAFEALDISVFTRIGMPHEFCYLRDPKLVWLHVSSDLLIGLAYVSIAATLAYLVYKASRDLPFNWVFLAFGLFIISCGFTHFMEVWVIWDSVYWMSGFVKVITAAASLATAIALFPLVPKVLRLANDARLSAQHRQEVERLNQELERFNYSVAHDLRAPLRGITGFGQALREEFAEQLPPQAQDYVSRMQKSATRMDALISDLLRYATIGKQEIQLRPVSMDDVLGDTIALLEAEIRERRAEVVLTAPLPRVIADATLLQVVLQNLVSNALKFVAPDVRPRIELRPSVVNGRAIVDIVDNGMGFPAGAESKVFDIFERFHPGHPGTGIGLAIVHRAVERLRGSVSLVESTPERGSRFRLELPAA